MRFQRNALAHAGKSSRRVVSAFIATAFAQPDHAAATPQWRLVADQMRSKLPRLATRMDGAEEDVCAYMTFPQQHRAKLHGTNPVERLNGEIKRRTDVAGIFPHEAAIRRLVGAILMEQTEEWAVQRSRYMTSETLAPVCEDPIVSLPAAQTNRSTRPRRQPSGPPRATPRVATRSASACARSYGDTWRPAVKRTSAATGHEAARAQVSPQSQHLAQTGRRGAQTPVRPLG